MCQLPFALGGLCCVARYLRTRDDRLAFAAGVIFGLGIYAYVTSVVMMPFYLMLFWPASWHAGVLMRRVVMLSLAGFVAALLPMAAWLVWHPDALRSILPQVQPRRPRQHRSHGDRATGWRARGDSVNLFAFIGATSYPSFMFVTGSNMRTLTDSPGRCIPVAGCAAGAARPVALAHEPHGPIAADRLCARRADSRGDQGRAISDSAGIGIARLSSACSPAAVSPHCGCPGSPHRARSR